MLSARVWSQRRLARVEATARHNNDRTGLSLRLQGAFAVMDRRVTAGPPITGSFAVVDLGQADMPVRLQNRIVTRTGRNGRALVTGLQPFSRNRLSVDQLDGDSGAVWHVTSFEAIPSRRSGIHVPLGASQSAAQQMVQLEDASGRAPAPGTPVTIAGKAHPLGVGYDGLLLLESPRPGAPIRAGACTARVPPPRDDGLPAVALCE